MRKSFGVLLCAIAAGRLLAAPAMWFQLDQTPVTGNLKITNAATFDTNLWGTLSGSGALPTTIPSATANGGYAWQFNQGYYLAVGPNAVTKLLGNVINTAGLSVAFWVNYASSNANTRVCGLGPNGETFDFMVQSSGRVQFTAGYQPNGTRWVAMIPSQTVFNGNWHHVVGALDFRKSVNNAVVYVDGVPVLTNSATFYNAITNAGSLNVGARGNGSPTACAIDQFIVYTNALQSAEVAQIYALGTVTNYAPVVTAGAAQAVLVQSNALAVVTNLLMATILDDGLPNPPGQVTNVWTQTGGPVNGAILGVPTNATCPVAFTNAGTYVFRCTVGDSALSDYDEVTVNVVTNSPPAVAGWATPAVMLATNPTVVALNGWVKDDGLPNPPGWTTNLWTLVSSPGSVSVVFANPTNVNTTATIPTNMGSYVLRLTASDSSLTGSADVTVIVTNNFAPVVAAWAMQPVLQWPSNTVNLQAQISDDGLPNPPGGVTIFWSKVSGAGVVTFGNAAMTNTTAGFSLPGAYQLQIAATDGQLWATNFVWVNVWSNSIGVNPPNGVRNLSATPPPYVHPRIFFTDADRPGLQARAASDSAVSNAIYGSGGLTNVVATTIDNPVSPTGVAYARLSVGDTTVDVSSLATNGVAVANVCMTGTGGLYENLASACYLAWLWPTNALRLQQLATAVATAATIENSWYIPNLADFLDSDVNADLGFCYDLTYDWMSDSQRVATRNLISRMTIGRHVYGWNEPDYTDSTNWRTHHDHLLIAQLAIEGETGYDAAAFSTNATSLKTFTTRWGITEGGFSREGTDYFSFGMHNASLAALALARRGENLFVTARIYNALQESFYMMAPWGVNQFGHNDGAGWGNDTTGIGIYFRVMKFMYPTDELADCVLRNFEASAANDSTPLARAIFGVAPLSGNTNFSVTATARNLNLVKFDAQRGLGVVRSDWGTNSLQLDFDCRFDTMSLGHLHSDRNNFDFWGYGRTWIGDPGYHVTENDAHSTILIDGIGEAGMSPTNYFHWPSLPGRWVDFVNQPVVTLFAGDASPAYDYSWDWNNLGTGTGYDPYISYATAGSGLTTPWRWVDLMYAPPGDLTGANAWMTNYIRANTNMFNPVQKAFRTTVMLRGTTPYALVVDDIQKDNSTHEYDWSANTIGVDPNGSFADPVPDVSFVSAPDATNAILYHAADTNGFQPRLLVRVLDAKGTVTPIQIIYETNAQSTHVRRLVISRTNVVAPDFKVLLFPHLSGAALPTTTWSNNLLIVQMADGQTDHIYFNTNADGRTRLQFYRLAGVGANPPPTNLVATAGNAQVTLIWSPVAGAIGYSVKSATNGAGPFALLVANVISTNLIMTGLVNGLSYYYEVSTLGTNGESENSAAVSAIPVAPPVVAPVWTAMMASNNAVNLNWSAVTNATSYRLQRSLVSGSGYSYVGTNATTNFTDAAVTIGTTYYYVVTAVNAGGEGPYSTETNATPGFMPQSLVWQGDGFKNIWDNLDATNLVWLSGGVSNYFWNGDTVTFNDTGSLSPALNIAVPVTPAGVVEFNTTNTYTVSGAGKITGSCGLQKDGGGTLTILNTNDFTGPLTVNAGTLQIGNGGTNGQHPGTISLAGGSLTVNRTDNFVLAGVISGASTNSAVNNTTASGPLTLTFAGGANVFASIQNRATNVLTLNGAAGSTNYLAGSGLVSASSGTLAVGGGTYFLTNAILNSGGAASGGIIIAGGTVNALGGGGNYWGVGTYLGARLNVNSGLLYVAGRANFATSGQTLTISGGQLVITNNPSGGNYGLRFGDISGAGDYGGGASLSGTQTGGDVAIYSGSFDVGSATPGKSVSYLLAGGTFTTGGGQGVNLGGSTNGTGTALLTLTNAGKLLVSGTLKGNQTTNIAQQIFAFHGGTLVVGTYTATYLRDNTNSLPGTLLNDGGTLAPGDLGTPGKTVITGNYLATNPAAALAIDIGGTNQAIAFQNGLTNYDLVSISGTASLGGSLSVSIINNYQSTIASNRSFTVLTATGGLTAAFANVANGRVGVANVPGASFQVVTNSTSVILTNYGLLLASFSATPTNGLNPLTVNFTDNSLGTITNRSWNFGDGAGTNTAATNLAHTFTASGTNLVTLIVTGPLGSSTTTLPVVVTNSVAMPIFGSISLVGGNLVFSGTNGTTGGGYLVLATTNLALPLTNWTIVSTNQFGPGGSVNFTNPVNPNSPATYYRLRLP